MPPDPPSLKRILTRWDLILYGLALLGPTAPYPVYGIVEQTSHGRAVQACLGATAAMLFTAAITVVSGLVCLAIPTRGFLLEPHTHRAVAASELL